MSGKRIAALATTEHGAEEGPGPEGDGGGGPKEGLRGRGEEPGRAAAAEDEADASLDYLRRQAEKKETFGDLKRSLTVLLSRVDYDALAMAEGALARARRMLDNEVAERRRQLRRRMN